MESFVYIVTHLPTGRKYVGKANDVAKRWKQHVRRAKKPSGYFHAALKKHGAEQFKITSVFVYESEEDSLFAERLTIGLLHTDQKGVGFNLDAGGVGGKKSAETRAKIGAANRGRKASPETCAKISAVQRGRKQSIESVAKRVASNTGKKRSPEARAKMSAGKRGVEFSAAHRANLAAAWEKRRLTPVTDESRAKMSASAKERYRKEALKNQTDLSLSFESPTQLDT